MVPKPEFNVKTTKGKTTNIPLKSNLTLGGDVLAENGCLAVVSSLTWLTCTDSCVLSWTSGLSKQIVWTARVQSILRSYFLLEIEIPYFL